MDSITMMPIMNGLTNDELQRCKTLFNYYLNLHIVRGTPIPTSTKCDTRTDSLKYMETLENKLEMYENILGKKLTL
jgi:hypothetical protein